MKKWFYLVIILSLFATLPQFSAQAQLGDVVMQPGDARLFYLLAGEAQVTIRVLAQAGDTLWFMLAATAPLEISNNLVNLRGEPLTLALEAEGENRFLSLPITENGDYFLQLEAVNNTAGYVYLNYDLTRPVPPSPGAETTFFDEPGTVQFLDTFENNDMAWWVGTTDGGSSTGINDGVMHMTLLPNGQLFGGFTSVPGSDQPQYYLTANVTILGDTTDTLLGLMYKVIDGANYYLFQLKPQSGEWRFLVLNEGVWSLSFGWNADSRLVGATDTHTVGVWVLGDYFVFIWDDIILGHVRDAVHTGGGIGVFAEAAPDSAGSPTYVWDNVRVLTPAQGMTWAQPILPEAATLSPAGGVLFGSDANPTTLQQDLIGEWAWSDDTNSTSMIFLFEENGDYTQTILTATDEPQEQKGRWYVEDDITLVLVPGEGLEQRYQPFLDVSKVLLTIPELGNRIFVRLQAESQE